MAKKKKQAINVDAEIKKKFGDVVVSGNYILDQPTTIVPISPLIDDMMGGGIPFGSFMISTGPPKVGKTSLALEMAASALAIPHPEGIERKLFFYDVEFRLNKRDLSGIRSLRPFLEQDRVHVTRSEKGNILSAETVLEIAEHHINDNEGSIFIMDSLSHLCSKSARDKEWDDGKAYRDDVPKFLSLFCKRTAEIIRINKSIFVGITHRHADTGPSFSSWAEGSGTKIQYEVDVKMRATHKKDVEKDGLLIGQNVFWECSCAPLLNGSSVGKCESFLRYGHGIDKEVEIIDIAVDLGLLTKSGNWYSIGKGKDKINCNGKDAMREHLVSNPELFEQINKQYREMMGYETCLGLSTS